MISAEELAFMGYVFEQIEKEEEQSEKEEEEKEDAVND